MDGNVTLEKDYAVRDGTRRLLQEKKRNYNRKGWLTYESTVKGPDTPSADDFDDNAIRYSSEQAQVFVNLTIEKQQLRLSIENSGHGVDAAVIQRLGERFYRALGTKTQGSGLGLSICQKIVDLHAGQLLFSPSDLGGLKVELLLNRVEP